MAITVEYTRIPGYPKETLSTESVQAIDKLRCAWDDRIALSKELLGYSVGGIIIQPPHKYDTGTEELYNVYAKSISTEAVLGFDTDGDYKYALLTVNYETLTYETDGTVYVTESLEPASEFLTLPYDEFFWGSDHGTLTADAAPATIIRMVDWVYTIHQISYVPNWIWTHPGTVNNSAITSYSFQKIFPAETLLCGNPSMSREITTDGATAWSITVRLLYRRNTWNKFPRPSSSGGLLTWEYLEDASSANIPIYELSNFLDIFNT